MTTQSAPRRMKQVSLRLTLSRTPAAMTFAWGAKARGRRRHSGSIFFRPLMVKGDFCALTGRAAFLFRGKFKRPFPPAACPHPVQCSLATLPLGLGSARTPRAACSGGALARAYPRPPALLGAIPAAPTHARRAAGQRSTSQAGRRSTPQGTDSTGA